MTITVRPLESSEAFRGIDISPVEISERVLFFDAVCRHLFEGDVVIPIGNAASSEGASALSRVSIWIAVAGAISPVGFLPPLKLEMVFLSTDIEVDILSTKSLLGSIVGLEKEVVDVTDSCPFSCLWGWMQERGGDIYRQVGQLGVLDPMASHLNHEVLVAVDRRLRVEPPARMAELLRALEACYIAHWLNRLAAGYGELVVFVDGTLEKLHRLMAVASRGLPNNALVVGVIKNFREDYLAPLQLQWQSVFSALEVGQRTPALLIEYPDGRQVVSVYVRVAPRAATVDTGVLRLEILPVDIQTIARAAAILYQLIPRDLPNLYPRMPDNNIFITFLESHLRKLLHNRPILKRVFT